MEKVSVDSYNNWNLVDFITGNQLKGELSSVFSSTVTIPNNDFDLYMELTQRINII